MACLVFGNPITEETLKGMPEYEGKEITRQDLVQAALSNMNNIIDKKLPPLDGPFTTVIIYNATGSEMMIAGGPPDDHHWSGMIQWVPPPTVANGQWVGFNHVADHDPPESKGAIVYRGKNGNGDHCDWMAAWDSIWNRENPGGLLSLGVKAYCEVRDKDHYTNDVWDEVSDNLNEADEEHDDHWNGCTASVKIQVHVSETEPIGGRSHGFLEATFTLES